MSIVEINSVTIERSEFHEVRWRLRPTDKWNAEDIHSSYKKALDQKESIERQLKNREIALHS